MEVSSNWAGYVATVSARRRPPRARRRVQERDRDLEAAQAAPARDGHDLVVGSRSGSVSAATARSRLRSSRPARRPTATNGQGDLLRLVRARARPVDHGQEPEDQPRRHDHGIGRRSTAPRCCSGSRTARATRSSRSASRVASPDLTSAEWIAEAPSECIVQRLLPADPAGQLRLGHVHEGGGARDRSRASATRAGRSRARSGSRRPSSSCRGRRSASSATRSSVPTRPRALRVRHR